MKLRLKDSFGLVPVKPGTQAPSPASVRKDADGARECSSGHLSTPEEPALASKMLALQSYQVIGQPEDLNRLSSDGKRGRLADVRPTAKYDGNRIARIDAYLPQLRSSEDRNDADRCLCVLLRMHGMPQDPQTIVWRLLCVLLLWCPSMPAKTERF